MWAHESRGSSSLGLGLSKSPACRLRFFSHLLLPGVWILTGLVCVCNVVYMFCVAMHVGFNVVAIIYDSQYVCFQAGN